MIVGEITLADSFVGGAVYPSADASIVTGVPPVRSTPVTRKFTASWFAGIVTLAGTLTREGSELVRFTVTAEVPLNAVPFTAR